MLIRGQIENFDSLKTSHLLGEGPAGPEAIGVARGGVLSSLRRFPPKLKNAAKPEDFLRAGGEGGGV